MATIRFETENGVARLMRERGQYVSPRGNALDFSEDRLMNQVPVEKLEENYPDMLLLSEMFNHEIVEMDGVYRWRPNQLMNWLHDYAPVMVPSTVELEVDHGAEKPGVKRQWRLDPWGDQCRGRLSLNELHVDMLRGMFTVEEYMKYEMQSGYSLCGFSEIFGQHEAYKWNLPHAKVPEGEDSYTETVIDYILRIHAGKVLKL